MSRSLKMLMMACVAIWAMVIASTSSAALVTSKHNLSVSGTGTVKAATETQVCIFCHAPHNSSPVAPLWNRRNPGSSYTPYTSSTTRGNPGQPTGASLLCLSCHDGTIALGDVLGRTARIAMSGGVTTQPAGNSLIGTDLSDDHPISFAYTAALTAGGELVNPATLTGRVRLDASGQMQCTACHDPHDDTNGKFLVMSNQASALCVVCHTKNYWQQSNHRLSTAAWNGVAPNPWPHTTGTTVNSNACESCHRPHSAGGKKWLLNTVTEEDNCYPCHNGHVASKNIQSEFTGKPSTHPVASYTGVHDRSEPAVAQSRHVECVDCHNPHADNATTGTLPGSLLGVRGVDINGSEINPASSEYQICFRCHSDSTGQPSPRTTRQLAQINTRLEFQTANPSYHPVAGVGKNTNVPSLIAPWTTASTMGCGDCHNNNAGPGANGTGPKGPHGSTYPSLLERQYVTTDRTRESAANYAICYKCHDRTALLGRTQPFGGENGHQRHLGTDVNATCNACHDPHGVSSTQGNAVNNSKLINFETTIVTPSSTGALRYESRGLNTGRCYLTCHGRNHNPESYP